MLSTIERLASEVRSYVRDFPGVFDLAFVAAEAALDFWRDDTMATGTARKGALITSRLTRSAMLHFKRAW